MFEKEIKEKIAANKAVNIKRLEDHRRHIDSLCYGRLKLLDSVTNKTTEAHLDKVD